MTDLLVEAASVVAFLEELKTLTDKYAPDLFPSLERLAVAHFNQKPDEPARLADDFEPMLRTARDSLIADATQRSSTPNAPTERPPALDEEPPTLRIPKGS